MRSMFVVWQVSECSSVSKKTILTKAKKNPSNHLEGVNQSNMTKSSTTVKSFADWTVTSSSFIDNIEFKYPPLTQFKSIVWLFFFVTNELPICILYHHMIIKKPKVYVVKNVFDRKWVTFIHFLSKIFFMINLA